MSYSHAGDNALAPRLQKSLEGFARKFWHRKSLRVFRDQTTLAVTPHLWPTIATALDEAEYFILLASPESAASPWVQKEVAHWLARNTPENFLIVLTAGRIDWDDDANDFDWSRTNALPEALRRVFGNEPKWEDLSTIRSSRDVKQLDPILRQATASLYATMTGRPLDEVYGEDVTRQAQFKQFLGAVAAVILTLGGLGLYAFMQANIEARERLRSQSLTLSATSLLQNKSSRYTRATLTAMDAVPDAARCDAREEMAEAAWALRASSLNHAWNLQTRVLVAHSGALYTLALSRDGAWLASGWSDGTIRVYDTKDWREVKTLTGHTQGILNLSFSPDGRYILSSAGTKLSDPSRDNTVRLWDWQTRTDPAATFPEKAHVFTARFDSSGRRILTNASGNAARLWTIDGAGVPEHELSSSPSSQEKDGVLSAAFSPDDTLVATGSESGRVILWEAGSGNISKVLSERQGERARHIAFIDGGQRVVVGGYAGTVRIFDVASGALIYASKDHKGTAQASGVNAIAVNPQGNGFATASVDTTIRLYDAANIRTAQILYGHESKVQGAAYTGDGANLVTWSQDGTVRIWATENGRMLAVLRGHTSNVNTAVLLPGGDGLVTGSDDGGLRVWSRAEPAGAMVLRAFPMETSRRGKTNTLNSVTFSPDAKRLAAGSWNGKAALFDGATGAVIAELPGDGAPVLSVAFANSGAFLATATGHLEGKHDRTYSVRIWDAESGAPRGEPLIHGSRLRTVAFSPDDSAVVAAAGDNRAVVWRLNDAAAQPLMLKGSHSAPVTSAAWSRDGKRIATSSMDRTVRLWDASSGAELASARPIKLGDAVYKVGWFMLGARELLLTASGDSRLTLWDPYTRKIVLSIDDQVEGESDWFSSVSALPGQGPEGTDAILAVTSRGAVRIWGLNPPGAGAGQPLDYVELAKLMPYDNAVYDAASDRSGTRIALAQRDGTARILTLSGIAELLPKAREAVGCCVTREERVHFGIGTVSAACKVAQERWTSRISSVIGAYMPFLNTQPAGVDHGQ